MVRERKGVKWILGKRKGGKMRVREDRASTGKLGKGEKDREKRK